MKKDKNVPFRDSYSYKFEFDIPEECPHCGKTMSPIIHNSHTNNTREDLEVNIGLFCQCAYSDCKRYYCLEYSVHSNRNSHHSIVRGKPKLISYFYNPPIKIDLPENIEKVSSSFVDIYSQATEAEKQKLDLIAGVGYRKAAEFLIKDYVISKNQTQADTIKRTMLGSVINKYLADFPKIQHLATAVAWIGNDETHYERKNNDKDIEDLKKFIRASAQFIAADFDADEALHFISEESDN